MNLEFKTIISDNLSDFTTIKNLLNKSTPDLENIKYICDYGLRHIGQFINDCDKEEIKKSITESVIDYNYDVNNIKNYQDILDVLGDEAEPVPYGSPRTNKQKYFNAHVMLINISKVFNQGWIPDWNNPNEFKYYPWFHLDDKGGGFRLRDVYYRGSASTVSAWLCFRTEELAKLSVELFKDIYKEYFEYK